jgi:hypothetical protein
MLNYTGIFVTYNFSVIFRDFVNEVTNLLVPLHAGSFLNSRETFGFLRWIQFDGVSYW